jgi:hypothetical protein
VEQGKRTLKEGVMADPLRSRVSRRRALKLGVGLAAVAAAAGPIEAFGAGTSGSATDLIDGVGEIMAADQHETLDRTNVVVRMVGDQTISARLTGFPAGFKPRVGDLVAVDTRTTRVLCSPEGQPITVESVPTAHPLTLWSVGTPMMNSGVLTIGTLRLVPSAAVQDAAQRKARIAVGTLESTLSDRQVLATRTA